MTSFFVRRDNAEAGASDFVLQPRANLFTGEEDFEEAFGATTSLEADLLLLGASVFAADRASIRGEREDRARRIELDIPVVNAGLFAPLQRDIEGMLRFLSNDGWRIKFRQAFGKPESSVKTGQETGRTLLFSGGLDSLAAAIEYGRDGQLQLVSHKTRNQRTYVGQRNLVEGLENGGIALPHFQFFISSRDGEPGDLQHAVEDSQRTRSFLFLILGTLAARRAGHNELLYLAENGQMAIHLPITSGRIGSFSTHTAHPDFLVAMERFLTNSLGVAMRIINPYLYRTKAEVAKIVVDELPELIPVSISCWRNARLPEGITHCGECIPCYVRRIALEYWIEDDATAYGKDPWTDGVFECDPDDIGRRNIVDLTEFIIKMERLSGEEVMSEWPELYSDNADAKQVMDMYRRFAVEARTVLGRYDALQQLLS